MIRYVTIPCLFIVLAATSSVAQETFKPRPSPLAIASVKFKDAYVKLTYSQPQKRGREIFGKLVPYSQIWRTGANEASEITLTKDMLVNEQPLKAGTYSIFTIPNEQKWTVIFNADVGLWGAYNYNPAANVLTFEIPVTRTDSISEAFTMNFDQKNELADLLMMWDNVKLSIPFKFIN